MSDAIYRRRRTIERSEELRSEKRSKRPGTPSWRGAQLTRYTSLGTPYIDEDLKERLVLALVSDRPDRAAGHLVNVLVNAMEDRTVAYRLWQTVEDAPARLDGTDRLACRAQQSARNTIAEGEDRGQLRPTFPFRASLRKSGRSSPPLHHGRLVVERGFDMAFLGTHKARRLSPADFPATSPSWLDLSVQLSPGLPLVVGNSTGKASWRLLSDCGALAVWTGRDLWTFLALEPFADPLEVHRQRVAPPSIR
ncbi:MAG: hypothetical protein AAGI22_18355 [Planctomycetota bacterium]